MENFMPDKLIQTSDLVRGVLEVTAETVVHGVAKALHAAFDMHHVEPKPVDSNHYRAPGDQIKATHQREYQQQFEAL